tara:strand:- start:10023 stop:10730 length:708 start_codon:yes stop_codon:yes gene_type:complete
LDQLNNLAHMTPYFVLWTTLVVGLVGSIHCVGMCGGIALACSRSHQKNVAYQIGRLLGYMALALVASSLGKGLDFAMNASGLTSFFGVLMGAMLIWIGLKSYYGQGLKKTIPRFMPKSLFKIYGQLLKRNAEDKSFQTSFFIGVFTIFLPCGLLYSLILALVTLNDPLIAVGGVISFWGGTLPLMASAPLILTKILRPLSQRLPAISSMALVLIGIITIVFRLNHIYAATGQSCH